MKIYVFIFLALLAICVKTSHSNPVSKSFDSSHHHHSLDGVWKLNKKWKYRWVKEWSVKKVYVPVWKKIWTPVEIKKWIPGPSIVHHK
ncbi:unnamed protein product [Ceutorhynchus assimilis]|uniref:Uncharacterized protein n=1 Tax=Ceutorhynchus assimilis TaxID=467358 RepID=A0A9N9QJP2_9CUCU|nr:unnamed protein product [Ceutorhynchus assimilis]